MTPLLEGVDRGSDLLVWGKPEEHRSVQSVKVRDEHRGSHDEEQHWIGSARAFCPLSKAGVLTVTRQEIGRVKTHLDGLDDELSSWLRESVGSKTSIEPDTLRHQYFAISGCQIATHSPPSSVRLVVLELSREEDGDEDLEDGPLHGDDSNDTDDGASSAPSLEVPKQLEEGDHTDHSGEMSQCSHGGTELVGVRIELCVSVLGLAGRG